MKHDAVFVLAMLLTLSSVQGFCEPQPSHLLEELRRNGVKDDAGAHFHLGEMYFAGWGVKKDYAEVLKWWQLAAAEGSAEAQNGLGVLYEYGLGVSQDYAQARDWYSKACDNGLSRGCDNYKKLKAAGY